MGASDSITPGGVAFEEIEGSPTIDVDDDGVVGVRVFKVNWASIDEFLSELMGVYELQDGSGNQIHSWQTGAVVVYSPAQLAFPGYPNAFVTRVSVVPFQPESPDDRQVTLDTQTNTYNSSSVTNPSTLNGAKITATYESIFDEFFYDRPFNVEPSFGTFITYGGEASGEILSVPGRTFVWQGSTEKLSTDLNPGIVIPTQMHEVNWHKVIAPPWNTMVAMIGKVNSSTFLGSPPGTVMYLGYKPIRTPRYQKSGTLWRIVQKFAQQAKFLSDGTIVGWNYLYKPTAIDGTEHWTQIVTADTSVPPHVSDDFSKLFAYGP